MTFKVIRGGYDLSPDDEQLVMEQRSVTKEVNNQVVQVGATWVEPRVKFPEADGWEKTKPYDTNLQEWIDNEDLRNRNVGFLMHLGWMDVDIDSPDPEYKRAIVAAMDFLKLDTTLRFGRRSVGVPSHVLIRLADTDCANWEYMSKFAPAPFKIDGEQFQVELRTTPTTVKDATRSTRQVVVPGSIYPHPSKPNEYDPSIWYHKETNRPARSIREISQFTPRIAHFNELSRAIAFGTLAYFLRHHWQAGSRQKTAQKVTGWLVRTFMESHSLNTSEHLVDRVFCPLDTYEKAESLVEFLCQYFDDDEMPMRKRALSDAADKLERNPEAQVPGWPAMQQLIGPEAANALRIVFCPGFDNSILTRMSERYLYDETTDMYVDRDRHQNSMGMNYEHESAALDRRHRSDFVQVGDKRKPAWDIFEASHLRKRIDRTAFYPQHTPSSVFRVDHRGHLVADDSEKPGTLVFNTWRGWPIVPPTRVDEALLNKCEKYLDQLLDYLTRDNKKQAEWVKKWIAYTFQFPADKQQIAWVCVGGQGVGKSFMGNIFLKAVFGYLWGTASPKVLEAAFVVSPFKDKMITFIDEAKFNNEAATDEIKKFIRNVEISGTEKFQDSRTYQIYSRIFFASNRFDMNIGQSNVRDRALFYTKAYDKDHLHMPELEFRAWTETLKPFFDEFNELLQNELAVQHFVHLFMTLPVNRHEVESIEHSSSGDVDIAASNMTYSRRIAKQLVEEFRVGEMDGLVPFKRETLHAHVQELVKGMGLRAMPAQRVEAELLEAGVLTERMVHGRKCLLFKYRYATTLEKFGAAIGVPLEQLFEFTEDDYGENDGTSSKIWRGGSGFVR